MRNKPILLPHLPADGLIREKHKIWQMSDYNLNCFLRHGACPLITTIVHRKTCLVLIDFLDLPSEIFSPDSGGSVNVRNSIDEIMAQGTTRLNV